MKRLRAWTMRLAGLFRTGLQEQELAAEMESHLQMHIEDNLRSGMTTEQSRRAALLKLGGLEQTKQAYRERSTIPFLESFLQDVRYVLRQMRHSPGFAITMVLTLALGIGAATAMFAIVDAVLLRPLVYPHANQLYKPIEIGAKGDLRTDAWLSYSDIGQWRRATHDSAKIAFSQGVLDILASPTGARLIWNEAISPTMLAVLGVQPMLGRGFLPHEYLSGGSHVVLLNYSTWKQAFASSSQILGKTVRIAGVPYSVIGVMPPHFTIPGVSFMVGIPEVWTPVERSDLLDAQAANVYAPILRVKSSFKPAVIEAELSSVQAHIAQRSKPQDDIAPRVILTGLHNSMVAQARPALIALEIAVGLVWLIACSNVAGLLLARIASRRVEIAVRVALGAGRRRIVRQFLTESLLLSSLGALGGLGLALFTLQIFRRMLLKKLPLAQNIHLSVTVLLALVGFTVLTGLLFGGIPAIMAAHAPIEETLKGGGPTNSGSSGQNHLRNVLLVSEIALSMVLLVGAGLMLRTVYALNHVSLGFRTDHIVLTRLNVPNYDYKDRDLNTTLWNPLLQRLQHLPGIQSAGLSTVLPIGHTVEMTVEYDPQNWTTERIAAVTRAASPGLMKVLGISMHAGRFFNAQDTANSQPVVVVNQAFVRSYLNGKDALGKPMKLGFASNATIVGVLDDIHQDAVATPSQPEIYLCMAQLKPVKFFYLGLMSNFMQLAVRTRTAPAVIIPELRRAIRSENPDLVAGEFITMKQAVEDSIGTQKLAAEVIGVFAGLALLVTVVGLYGLLNYFVTQRTREIGIRMALGAGRGRVMWMVLCQALALLIVGITSGLVLAFWCSRLLHSFLYGVSKHDPWTLIMVPLLLLLFGAVATFIPARRAASTDPMLALRAE